MASMRRLSIIQKHLAPPEPSHELGTLQINSTRGQSVKSTRSITARDSKTGKSVEVPVLFDGVAPAVRATDVGKAGGVLVFDPGYMNTAVCRSKITYIDGGKGILKYRGYAIEDLAENCSFLEGMRTSVCERVWFDRKLGN